MRHPFHASHPRFFRTPQLATVAVLAVLACANADDTTGEQRAARWVWHGRVALEFDSTLTLARVRVDSGLPERHDVLFARYDFDPASGAGDEYALTIGLDLGDARALPVGEGLPLGAPPDGIAAVGTVTCLCRPLRPDSVRGTLTLRQRGMRQLTARIDARLHFTAWADSSIHATYPLRQTLYGVR